MSEEDKVQPVEKLIGWTNHPHEWGDDGERWTDENGNDHGYRAEVDDLLAWLRTLDGGDGGSVSIQSHHSRREWFHVMVWCWRNSSSSIHFEGASVRDALVSAVREVSDEQ